MSTVDLGVDFAHRKVRIAFQVAAPTSFNPEDPLVASGVINPNKIILTEHIDEIDQMGVESIRAAWIEMLQNKKINYAELEERNNRQRTDPVTAALRTVTEHLDRQGLAQWVMQAKLPIPDNYVVSLPDEGSNMRRDIIYSLVPFHGTRDLLLSLEAKLQLPMRIVGIFNAPVSKNEVELHRAEAELIAEAEKLYAKIERQQQLLHSATAPKTGLN